MSIFSLKNQICRCLLLHNPVTLCPRKLWHPAPNELEPYHTSKSWHTIASSWLWKTTCTYAECMLTIYWPWPDVRLTQPIRQWRCRRRRRFFFMLLNLRLCHRIYNISLISMNHDHTEKPVTACTCVLNYTKCRLFYLSAITEVKL